MENKLRQMVERGEHPFGTFFEMGGANVVEALGQTGLDYLIIDNEHGPFDVESSLEAIRACESSSLTPLCRVREISRPAILKLLDVGAAGLIVPCVDDISQVKKLVEYAKYAPVGRRGFSGSRKDRWGYAFPATGTIEEQMAYWNRETLLIPQCETTGCLSQIEEIAALPGVDGIFVGPFDLSISMGIPGQFQNPEFLAALRRILDACRTAGKFTMIFTNRLDWVADYYRMGFDMVAYSMDCAMMVNGFRSAVAEVKKSLAP